MATISSTAASIRASSRLNLVDVALASGGDMEKFWKVFDERLDLCYRALMCRHNRLKGTLSDAAPILWQYGAISRLKKGEPIDALLYGGYSTISLGYAGLCECVRYMTGKSHTDPSATPFALAVMKYMNDCVRKMEGRDHHRLRSVRHAAREHYVQVRKVPAAAASASSRASRISRISQTATTSTLPSILTRLQSSRFESQFQALSTGGAISYVEVPNMQNNLEAVLQVIQLSSTITSCTPSLTPRAIIARTAATTVRFRSSRTSGKLVWACPNCGNTRPG